MKVKINLMKDSEAQNGAAKEERDSQLNDMMLEPIAEEEEEDDAIEGESEIDALIRKKAKEQAKAAAQH